VETEADNERDERGMRGKDGRGEGRGRKTTDTTTRKFLEKKRTSQELL